MVYDINIEGVSLIRNYMDSADRCCGRKIMGLIKIIDDKNKTFFENGTS